MQILFFINPISGGFDKSEITDDIKVLCEMHDMKFQLYFTEQLNFKLKNKVNLKINPQRIIVIGGDGTIKQAVDLLAYLKVPFGVVPLGSANGTAKEIGLSTDYTTALLDAVFSENTLVSDVVSVNNKISVHLADIGTNSELISKFEQEPERGFMSYAKHLYSTIVETELKDFFIKANGLEYNWTGYMLSFANAAKYGSGIVINPGGDISDGFFELCNVKDLSLETILLLGLSKFADDIEMGEYIQQIKTKSAVVTTKEPHLLQIDGELIGEFTEFNIEIVPNYFKYIIP